MDFLKEPLNFPAVEKFAESMIKRKKIVSEEKFKGLIDVFIREQRYVNAIQIGLYSQKCLEKDTVLTYLTKNLAQLKVFEAIALFDRINEEKSIVGWEILKQLMRERLFDEALSFVPKVPQSPLLRKLLVDLYLEKGMKEEAFKAARDGGKSTLCYFYGKTNILNEELLESVDPRDAIYHCSSLKHSEKVLLLEKSLDSLQSNNALTLISNLGQDIENSLKAFWAVKKPSKKLFGCIFKSFHENVRFQNIIETDKFAHEHPLVIQFLDCIERLEVEDGINYDVCWHVVSAVEKNEYLHTKVRALLMEIHKNLMDK